MAASSDDSDRGRSGQKWDGYSDFQTVSSRIGTLIFDAIEAYAEIHSAHVEGAPIDPNRAARARSRILAAAVTLNAELSHERDMNDDAATILDRWNKGRGSASVEVEVPSDGFVQAFRGIRLYDDDPEWLGQFVTDFWRAGWELGYLKAGEHEQGEPADPVEVDAEAMFI